MPLPASARSDIVESGLLMGAPLPRLNRLLAACIDAQRTNFAHSLTIDTARSAG